MLSFFNTKVISLLILIISLTLISLILQEFRGADASLILSGQRSNTTELQKLQKKLNINLPLWQKFINKLRNIIQFDLGNTIKNKPVFSLILSAFHYTFILAFSAAIIALFLGIFSSILAQVYPNLKTIVYFLNQSTLTTPIFIIALILIWLFSIYLEVLPVGGTQLSYWYLLPSIALALKAGSRLSLFALDFFQQESQKAYILTAHAYGFSKWRIYSILIFKNLALPLLSLWLIDFGSYLAGAAIVETIFSIPGLGSLLIQSLFQYDLNLTLGILVFTSLLIYSISLLQEGLDIYYQKFRTS